jgi:hypothetical protein
VRRSGRAATRRGGGFAAVALVSLLVLILLAPSGASARGLKTGLQDSLFGSTSTSTRDKWVGEAVKAGAGVIRVNVGWATVVGSRRPIAPTNPADPAYDFGSVDTVVRAARSHGLDVLLTVYNAPRWAEGKNRPRSAPSGTWKPNPHAFGQFAQAVARRYSGHFLNLPRVKYFQAWNEPNLSQYLNPQWKGKKPASPSIFRRMLNAFYDGVKKGQRGGVVMNGGTTAYGDPAGGQRMRPMVFLRNLFCLNRKLKATKCPDKPHLDVVAHHPITDGSPTKHAFSRDDVPIADFNRIRKVVKAAKRTHHIRPGGNHPLWVTELWWNTNPPNRFGFPVKTQARWIEQAFYELWKQGASTVINLEIRDSPAGDPANTLQSGIFFHSNKKKPSYKTFRFPFVTHRKSKGRVGAWGKAPESGKLKIQKKSRKGWQTVKSSRVKRGHLFQEKLRQRGAATFRGKVGKTTSMPWHQGG